MEVDQEISSSSNDVIDTSLAVRTSVVATCQDRKNTADSIYCRHVQILAFSAERGVDRFLDFTRIYSGAVREQLQTVLACMYS